jgi:hypothetical protein
MLKATAVVTPVLLITTLSGLVVNAGSSAAAIARAGAAHASRAAARTAHLARASATNAPEPAGVREAAVRAEIMRLRALGHLRGPVLAELIAQLAAQTGTELTGTGLMGPGLTSTGLTSTGPMASAVTSGTITGVVRGIRGLPLRGACVTATSRTGTLGHAGWAGTKFAMTDADGRYVLTGLRPGSYTLAYRDCAVHGRYFSQWSGGAAWPSLATPVSVTAGQVRVAPSVTLRPTNPAALLTSGPLTELRPGWVISTGNVASTAQGGRISGLVTGNGHPLKGICVTALRLIHNGAELFPAKTSRTGTYSVGGLQRGRYWVLFGFAPGCNSSGNWLPQWYNHVSAANPFSQTRPTTIVVGAGQKVHGIDATLKMGGQISGIVTDKSGKKLRGICVQVTQIFRNGAVIMEFQTDRSGSYALHGVFPGRYTVEFSTGCLNKGNYAPQWWRDSPTDRHVTIIHIIGPRIANHIDATLQPGAVLTGVVQAVNASGQLLSGVCVGAVNRDGSVGVLGLTKANGSYRLAGLGTGQYQVTFDPTCGGSTITMYLGTSTIVTAHAGTTKAGVNAFLQLGAGVSGTVTDSHGHPVGGICVLIGTAQQGPIAGAKTAADGTYTIEGVPAGPYVMAFSGGCGNSGSYAPQFYKDEPNLFDADSVTLTTGDITPSIDTTMQPGGTITGVVTDRAGHRLGGICVAAFGLLPGIAAGSVDIAFTGNGNFRMPDLAPGLYEVQFTCGGKYAGQDFRSTTNSPDLISVNPGTVTRGINAALSLAGTISGVVTDRAGHPLPGICAAPFPLPLTAATFVVAYPTNRHGAYRATGLAPGTYAVQFSPCGGHPRYGTQWYHGKATLAAATKVRVTGGGAVKGIGAVMTVGGSITGQVRAASSNTPVRGACVLAIDQAAEAGGTAVTNFTGHYTISGLATGNYQLLAGPCNGQNLATITRPGTVHVTAPHTTTHIDAALPDGGTVSGTVLGGSPTAKPQEGICVDIVPTNLYGYGAGVVTAADGTYSTNGLAAGAYQVLFGDPYCPFNDAFAPIWYNHKPSQSTADAVTVTAGATTSGINATLLPGGLGAISGTVTGPSSAPVGRECVTAFNVSATLGTPFSVGPPEIAVTHPDGTYTLRYMLPGTYQVRFDVGCGGPKFSTQWWDDAATQPAATIITVSANTTTTGINASLQP